MLVPLAFDSTPVMAQDSSSPAPQARYSDPDSIPYGHRPPPGMCRVWLPGVAPGQQSPPVPCETPTPEAEPTPEPEPQPEPEPEPEPCVTIFTTVNGVAGFLDCNGVFTPAFPG
jgi:hypothetical protein